MPLSRAELPELTCVVSASGRLFGTLFSASSRFLKGEGPRSDFLGADHCIAQSLAPRTPQGRDGWMDGITNDYKDRKKLEQARQRNRGEEMRIKERTGKNESDAGE